MLESITVWERLPDETPKGYEAFCHYRDMGYRRSLGKLQAALGLSNNRGLKMWSSKFNWVDRAKAYDAHIERDRREALISSDTAAHALKLEAFRSNTEKMGGALLSTGAQMLDIGQSQIKILRDSKSPLPVREIHSFIRTAAAIAQIGSSLTAEALGVERLMNVMAIEDDDGEND